MIEQIQPSGMSPSQQKGVYSKLAHFYISFIYSFEIYRIALKRN